MFAKMRAIAYQKMLWMRSPSTLLVGVALPCPPHRLRKA